ncbi:hypothetical protein BZG36_04528 [Bifiguratus adelaidae]|uniref:Uncharacterized protein n=1 Tax=Bifiguratus adelaidae TaxID=1938954 RepID=A0A261XXZ9_9FUNG|nr:hypothetical protein BZG36_04528 [Bifiguratus adelaidae]
MGWLRKSRLENPATARRNSLPRIALSVVVVLWLVVYAVADGIEGGRHDQHVCTAAKKEPHPRLLLADVSCAQVKGSKDIPAVPTGFAHFRRDGQVSSFSSPGGLSLSSSTVSSTRSVVSTQSLSLSSRIASTSVRPSSKSNTASSSSSIATQMKVASIPSSLSSSSSLTMSRQSDTHSTTASSTPSYLFGPFRLVSTSTASIHSAERTSLSSTVSTSRIPQSSPGTFSTTLLSTSHPHPRSSSDTDSKSQTSSSETISAALFSSSSTTSVPASATKSSLTDTSSGSSKPTPRIRDPFHRTTTTTSNTTTSATESPKPSKTVPLSLSSFTNHTTKSMVSSRSKASDSALTKMSSHVAAPSTQSAQELTHTVSNQGQANPSSTPTLVVVVSSGASQSIVPIIVLLNSDMGVAAAAWTLRASFSLIVSGILVALLV